MLRVEVSACVICPLTVTVPLAKRKAASKIALPAALLKRIIENLIVLTFNAILAE
jgi:hypothetical protein